MVYLLHRNIAKQISNKGCVSIQHCKILNTVTMQIFNPYMEPIEISRTLVPSVIKHEGDWLTLGLTLHKVFQASHILHTHQWGLPPD